MEGERKKERGRRREGERNKIMKEEVTKEIRGSVLPDFLLHRPYITIQHLPY